MSSDIEKTVSEQMNDKMYALQADESIDIGGISQLLVFTRYIADKINEIFCAANNLCKLQDIIYSLQ